MNLPQSRIPLSIVGSVDPVRTLTKHLREQKPNKTSFIFLEMAGRVTSAGPQQGCQMPNKSQQNAEHSRIKAEQKPNKSRTNGFPEVALQVLAHVQGFRFRMEDYDVMILGSNENHDAAKCARVQPGWAVS